MTDKSTEVRLIKLPWPYSAIRWIFPKVEFISSRLAGKLAVKLFFRPFRVPVPEREIPIVEKAKSKIIDVQGKKVVCYEWGRGVPVILVHGWSGRSTQFFKFIEIFMERGFQVISFDAPGHGKSQGIYTSVIDFAEIIKELVSRYHVETLIGHSLGGVASLVAFSEGAKVKNILTINSPTIGEEILHNFLLNINGSSENKKYIKEYVFQIRNKPYEEYMPMKLLAGLNDVNLRMIHDKHDKQVPVQHAYKVKEAYPHIDVKITEKNGHNRILANEEIIHEALTFSAPSS